MTSALIPDIVAGAPVLMAIPPSARTGEGPPPVVLWFHGFRADALANAAELQRLADAGFLAVGVDAVGHGRRIAPDLPARILASPGGALPVMFALAEATAREIPAILDEISARGLGDRRRAGLVGVSMGAFLVYRALLEVPVRAAVAVLGSPEWPGADSPHRAHPASFRDVALLSVTAGHDQSVPPDAARAFHRRLTQGPPGAMRHEYLELLGAPHLVDASEWETVVRAAVAWLSAGLR